MRKLLYYVLSAVSVPILLLGLVFLTLTEGCFGLVGFLLEVCRERQNS